MQEDSINLSTSGHMTHNDVATQESPNKSFQCSRCTLFFKSKVYLFEHLNKVHGLDVDAALREAGLKCSGTNKANADNNNSPGDDFECQHCDFKAGSRDLLNEHGNKCHEKTGDQNMIGNLIISENPETKITVGSTNQHSDAAEAEEIPSVFSVMSTSKSKCTLNSSKDLKTYKRPLQTITKYFEASSGSNGKPPVKLADSPKPLDDTKRTIILQESPSCSNPNSSGVFKVTAKSRIDISRVSHRYLLNDHLLNTDLRPPKPKEKSRETVPDNVGKRTNNESSKCPPAKKAKPDKQETKLPEEANATEQPTSRDAEFSFDVSEDEGEKKPHLVNGDAESSKAYFCRHCDYSDVDIACVSTHYQSNHPYVRYNAAYIKDPSDESATFRCLQCPVEFISVAYLKRHYTENHPEGPNVFTMQSRELSLVFKCFACRFTTGVLKALKDHYKDNHATYEVDNSLMYCRYLDGRQEGSSRSNSCERAPSPERQGGVSPERACTPCKEVKNAPSPQHPTSTGADVVLYRCNYCEFSHKSAVVMHVHYQKSHPGEEVTIDKIKQSARATSHSSHVTPVKSPNSVTVIEKSAHQTSDSSKKTKEKAEPSQRKRKRAPEASKAPSESHKTKKVESVEERSKRKKVPTKHYKEMSTGMDSLSSSSPSKLFYCQFCSYSSTNIKSVVGHHNAKHAEDALTCIDDILCYSAEVQQKKLQSEEVQQGEDDAAESLVRKSNPYAHAEDLFFCQKCNYGNPSLKGIANHQTRIHKHLHYSRERIIDHTALIRDEIERSKSQAREFSFSTRLPLPLMNEGDEDMFFCHFCNYRQSTRDQVVRHYIKKHRGFVVTGDKGERVSLYTSMVREKTKKSHIKTTANQEVDHASLEKKGNKKKKTMKHGKSLPASAPPSMTASQTQRILRCYRCPYRTQYLNVLRRHMWKIHRTNRSITDVLRTCFQQGDLKTGHHCYLCVFSHQEAAAVYEHYKEQHPGNIPSFEYVTSRLFVSPETRAAKRKKPQKKHTDGISDGEDDSLPSERSGQNETKSYSCRACSFKGRSMSVIARHYRAVHPWSVKEDGSVLGVVNSKRSSANRQVQEDHSDMPGSFESYQVPLEFDKSPEETESSTELRCPYCPATFHTQHGLNTHCGMKHHKAGSENSDEPEQEQTQKRMHVFKCPHCTYVNTNYQGVLTHCQFKHPRNSARAYSLHVDEAHLPYWGDCLRTKGPGNSGDLKLSGYMCETCPKVCATLKKLNRHCKKDHTETVVNTAPKPAPKPVPKPSVVSKVNQFKTLSNRGTSSHASFLSKKVYAVVKCQYCAYSCSTKIALSRHVLVHHKKDPVSKVQDCEYHCVLCSKSYSTKRRLGSHYVKKHGRDSFIKYYAPVYKQAPEKPTPTSPDRPLTPQPENTREACTSGTTATEEYQTVLIYRCPTCPYVNASYHGTLTHCQMKHPDIVARADELQTEEIFGNNMVGCSFGKASNERGYMCKICPLIFASLKKLRIHCERVHGPAGPTEQAAEPKKQPDHDSLASALKALKSKASAASATETSFHHQSVAPETCQSNSLSAQNEERLYKCHICTYTGFFRRYLQVHYKNTHKLDPLTTNKLLLQYNKRKRDITLPEAESEESAPMKCKKCPEEMFDSPELLVAHYSTFHSSDGILDFTVISQGIRKGSTGLYRCIHCLKQMNGVRKLWYHLDCHRESARKRAVATEMTASPVAKSIQFCRQDELLTLDTVEDLAQWNVTPAETFTFPPSPLSSPSKPADVEQPQLESGEDKNTCKQCRRTFMSLKGLRSHERSHAATAALKKMINLPTSVLKHNINKYVVFKPGTLRPFLCSICSYRTTVMGLWRSHFMKTHQDVIVDPAETDDQDEESDQRADGEPFNLSEELNYWPELDEDPEISETESYLEPPDVQRQLNHYSLRAQADAPSKTNVQETQLPESNLLHCDFCNFNTGHLSSMRRHYLNRHGKKILRCKVCDFVTGLRKTLEMHMETCHSTCQSEPTHQKDLRCPFCLYQTKNKNNMIDHIVLHREERVVPIEVRRSKLSRYLQGVVFRCHKCTFTSGSADNLRLHMKRHDDVKPYKCRLCYFDCTRLSDLEAHLSDKHQVVRNHELVGQISLDELQARVDGIPEEEEEEPSSNLEHHNDDSEDVETEEFVTDCDDIPHETQAKDQEENSTREEITLQTKEAYQKQGLDGKNEEGPAESSQEQAVVLLPAQLKLRDGEDSSIVFTQHKEEAALRHSLLPDEDGSIRKTEEKADQDRTVKTEIVDNVQSETTLLDIKGSIPLAHNSNSQVNTEANNSRAPESFTVERHLLTLSPKCAPLRMSHNESLGVSITNCKQEKEPSLKSSEEVREPYGEMPVLENEYLKEEMQPLGCCKEEDQSDQDKEDETITEDEENRTNQKHEEGDGIKEAGDPRVTKGALSVTDGAAEVPQPAATQDKPFTCELCGRNLMNSSELERHIMRHRI
ncbi:zinc finger protein 462-like isoform X1 [Sebastes fasciatus]|uniref:zinc finger protein 462-like isoform X1 n=1 Tax=Sebastes fasciatus TaxID=394691 RepID=UPI003D9F99CB